MRYSGRRAVDFNLNRFSNRGRNLFIEQFVNNVFEVDKEAIDRVSRRRSIEATAKPDNRIL